MRYSSLTAGALFLLVAASSCAIKPKEQKVFEDATQPAQTASRDWNGETITIHNDGIDDGVNMAVDEGGVEVKVSSTATKVSVEAVFGAHADDDKEPNARQSIEDAIKTLTFTETANSFDIRCGHGETHGTSRAAGSGCKLLRVTIPAGNAAQPHSLAVANGSGSIRFTSEGAATANVRTLRVHNTGATAIELDVSPVKDASLAIGGEGAVNITLPGDFSARMVVLGSPEDGAVTTDFPGMTSGASYPTTGPSPDAIAELNVQAKGPVHLATTGTVPILSR